MRREERPGERKWGEKGAELHRKPKNDQRDGAERGEVGKENETDGGQS